MKFLNLILVAFVLTLTVSCGEKNPILGEWKLDGVNIEKAIKNVPDETKEFARSIMTSAFDQVKGKMKLNFTEDGKYKLESPLMDGRLNIDNGTYTVSKDKKQLITLVKGRTEKITIVENTEARLVLGMSFPGFGIMEMTFIH